MSSTDFDDVSELLCFVFKFNMQSSKAGKEDSMSLDNSSNVHDSREAVITRLTSVDMVVRMN